MLNKLIYILPDDNEEINEKATLILIPHEKPTLAWLNQLITNRDCTLALN